MFQNPRILVRDEQVRVDFEINILISKPKDNHLEYNNKTSTNLILKQINIDNNVVVSE